MRIGNLLKKAVLFLLLISALIYPQLTQNGSKGLLRTNSAQTLGRGVLGVGTSAYFGLDNEFIKRVLIINNDSAYLASGFKPTYISTFYNIGYGLFNFWDINFSLPFYIDNNNIGETGSSNGIGDLSIAMKIQYPPYEHSHVFDMTYFGQLFIPTAKKNMGLFPRQPYYASAQNLKESSNAYRLLDKPLINSFDSLHYLNTPDSAAALYREFKAAADEKQIPTEENYYGAGNVAFLAKMLWTFDASEINPDINIKWHLNYGALFTAQTNKDNIFELGSMIEWTPHPVVTIFTDFYGQARFGQLTAGFDLGKEPLILGTGLCFNIPGGAHISVAFDKGFAVEQYQNIYYNAAKGQAYETKIFPSYGLSVGLSWCGSIMGGDADKDGIPDKIDNCPDEPEDVDGFEDLDGCPDPDNDHDGILDIRDKCPNKAEDFDNFQDEDGCPDTDNDKDVIIDAQDKCPNDPEDKDGFEDRDGCPDYDNDKDGLPDSLDRCQNDPEDLDGYEDKDGCPDSDNDKDGIPDSIDKCPTQPENINGFQDQDGCPDVKTKEIESKMVLEGVNFKTNSADLTFESGAILDKIIESLVAYPDVCVEIRGHTDNVGPRVKNRQLSEDRANSVKSYMVSKGVDQRRIKTIGMGPDAPIASNAKAEGRAKNRRIEMTKISCN